MVGRGEVDEDLEGETKEECEKYGKVIKCVIFEVRPETQINMFTYTAAADSFHLFIHFSSDRRCARR